MISSMLLLSVVCAAEDDLLATAAERIRTHRTGDLAITIVDAQGTPVPGASVAIAQTRHDFLFGSNIFALGTFEDKALENAYRARFKELLNFATLAFQLKLI